MNFETIIIHFAFIQSTPMDYADDSQDTNIMNIILEKFSDRIINDFEDENAILGYYG